MQRWEYLHLMLGGDGWYVEVSQKNFQSVASSLRTKLAGLGLEKPELDSEDRPSR